MPAHSGSRASGSTELLRLSDLLRADRVKIPLSSTQKRDLLRELVDLVTASVSLDVDPETLHAALQEREEVLSTGIGGGIAIPHARVEGLSDLFMAAGVSREPVDFDALDDKPVRLFFLILGPERQPDAQVRLLSRIARLMREEELCRRLAGAPDPDAFLRALEEAERTA